MREATDIPHPRQIPVPMSVPSWIASFQAPFPEIRGQVFKLETGNFRVLDPHERTLRRAYGRDSEMPDRRKTRAQLLEELAALRDRVAELQAMVNTHKGDEEALRESEERFRSIFEGSLDSILLADPVTGEIIDANPAAEELLLMSREEIVGLHQSAVHPPRIRESAKSAFQRIINEGDHRGPAETILQGSDGTEKVVEILAQVIQIDGRPTVFGVFRDIRERKKVEEALRESEARLRTAIDSIPFDVFLIDAEGRYSMQNIVSRRRWGNVVGKRPEDIAPDPETLDLWRNNNRKAVAGEVVENEVRFSLHGEERHYYNIVTPIRDREQIRGVLGVNIDITRRKRAEQALRESEQKLSLVLDGVPWLICYVSGDQRYLYVNRAYADWYGTSPDQVVGKPVNEVLDEQAYRKASGSIERALAGVRASFEDTAHDREGRERTVQATYVPHMDEQGDVKGCFVLMQDTTDRKRMEMEMLKVQKLESLGVLAGGIAHDFNNLLTVIMANLSMARAYGGLGEESSGMLADAEKASFRAQALTQQLLAFSKGGQPTRKTVSLEKLLKETGEFTLAGSNVGCDFEIQRDLWPASVDEGQITQVINNLVINADQAMPEGGTIRISAENAVLAEETPIPLKSGKYVKISVADQGVGISPKHLSKVFDPFFTTKIKGSGLGLSSSYTILKNHGGHIRIDSEVDLGTTVVIYLPAAETALADSEPKKEEPFRGTGRILLIDDEEMIRRSTGRMLERLGYEVALASDGTDGIELYRRAMELGSPFHLVILDLTIRRGMGGDQAMRELLRIDPDVKVIVSSGYSANPIMSSHREHGFCGVVPKPYTIDDLAASIFRVLHRVPR